MSKIKKLNKIVFIILGTISVCFALLGIILPGLPTTPFVLLSAFCFSKSSDKLYNWLINNKLFGKYIKDFNQNKSVTIYVKIYAIFIMWLMIIISCLFLVSNIYIQLLICLLGLIGTIVMGFIVKTKK